MLQLSSSGGWSAMGRSAYLVPGESALPGDGSLAGDEHALRCRAAADRERELLHRIRHEPVERPGAASARDLDQPGFLQNAQMMRNRRLRKTEPPSQLAGTDLALAGDPVDDRDPSRVGESLEPPGEGFGGPLRQRRCAGGAAG